MTLHELNHLSKPDAIAAFSRCCSAERWQCLMVESRPYKTLAALLGAAQQHWQLMREADYLQAFEGHPQIGDVHTLKAKYCDTHQLAACEQAGAQGASDAVLHALVQQNQAYLAHFGFIFIVCATGKSAEQMLALLKLRLHNTREQELQIAAAEQAKIFTIRLKQLVAGTSIKTTPYQTDIA